jgi:hypothetical protein
MISNEVALTVKSAPKEGKAEIVLKIAEAGIAAIPVIGGPLAVLSEFLGEPYNRRKQRWLEELAGAVSELQERSAELSKPLEENDQFLTAVLHASQIAMRAHQEEKLLALRNSVRNSALKSAPNDDRQLMFLRFVDDFTVSHIRVLSMFDNPGAAVAASKRAFGVGAGGLSLLIFHCVPELNGQGQFCEQVCRDLENRGLIAQGSKLNVMMTTQGMLTARTTDFGKEFLKFVS